MMMKFNEIERLDIGGRSMPVSGHTEFVTEDQSVKLKEFALSCATNFVNEATLVQNKSGLPTYIGRLDYTVTDNEPRLYEFEERPSGLGISSMVSPEFNSRIRDVLRRIGQFAVVLSKNRKDTDDRLLGLNVKTVEQAQNQDEPLLIRAEPGEDGLESLVHRSISTVHTKGDKSYGERIGIFRAVDKPENLPDRHSGFALKPLQGSKAKGVMVYHPKLTASPGFRAYRKMQQAVSERPMYLQKLHLPIQTGNMEYPNMIYRLFVDYTTGYPELIGGCYMARKDVVVHGSLHSVIGPLEVK
jgi:hypothetical protein